jgi:hypothetical protein
MAAVEAALLSSLIHDLRRGTNRLGGGGRAGAGVGRARSEVTHSAARELGLAVGSHVIASWKATATRLVEQ